MYGTKSVDIEPFSGFFARLQRYAHEKSRLAASGNVNGTASFSPVFGCLRLTAERGYSCLSHLPEPGQAESRYRLQASEPRVVHTL
ncbi:MAG: hypothetical protein CSA31_01355 [Desulfobulbus propionicus]|nr:MAG: hypothetical protein CSA31_01355 [Desulfobulbus propionicus]